eukprot:767658-Hanusia_phi.AAC.1
MNIFEGCKSLSAVGHPYQLYNRTPPTTFYYYNLNRDRQKPPEKLRGHPTQWFLYQRFRGYMLSVMMQVSLVGCATMYPCAVEGEPKRGGWVIIGSICCRVGWWMPR